MNLIKYDDGTSRATVNGVEVILGLDMDEYHRNADTANGEIQYYSKTRLHAICQEAKGPEWVANQWNLSPGGKVADDGDRDVGDGNESHYKVGRAIDDLCFGGPEAYKAKYIVPPELYPSEVKRTATNPGGTELKPWTMKAKYCQDWRDTQVDEGRDVLTNAQAEWIERAHFSMLRHPEVKMMLSGGTWISQVTLRWQDPESGRWLQCRPDLINFDAMEWADLKTTRYWLHEAYGRQYFNLGYHLQSHLIDEGMRLLTGSTPRRRRHIICGKQAWPQVRVDDLTDHHIDAGRALLRRCIAEYERCEATNAWYEVQVKDGQVSIPNFIQAALLRREDPSSKEFYEIDRYEY